VVGREVYERANWWLHAAVGVLCDVEQSGLTFTLVYNWARGDIRVSWHASVMPRSPFATQPVRVDGISVYEYSPSARENNPAHHRPRQHQRRGRQLPWENFRGGAVHARTPPGPGGLGRRGGSRRPHDDTRRGPRVRPSATDPRWHGGERRPRPRARARKDTALAARADGGSEEGACVSKNRARARFGLPALSRAEFDAIVAAVGRQAEGGWGRTGRGGVGEGHGRAGPARHTAGALSGALRLLVPRCHEGHHRDP